MTKMIIGLALLAVIKIMEINYESERVAFECA
jgi:hypothetical protein